MARAFVFASSQGLQSATLNLSSFNRASISFWLNWTTFANNDHLAAEYSANFNTNNGGMLFNPDSSTTTKFDFGYKSSNNTVSASFTRPSAGVWHNYVMLLDGTTGVTATTFPAIYVDGVSQSLSTSGNAPPATNLGNYALNFMCRNQASLFADGSMADVAIWADSTANGLLTQGEATSLANGARPRDVRQNLLRYWWPIDGLQSPEPDFGGTAANATLTNAPVYAAGPPLMQFTPRWPQKNSMIMLPAAGLGKIIERRNRLGWSPKK